MSDMVFMLCGLVALMLFEARLQRRGRRRPLSSADTPWYVDGVFAVTLTAAAVQEETFRWSLVIYLALATWLAGRMVRRFYKQRPQFSIKAMLLATLFVAAALSANHYVSALIVGVLVMAFLSTWAEYRQGEDDAVPTDAAGAESGCQAGAEPEAGEVHRSD